MRKIKCLFIGNDQQAFKAVLEYAAKVSWLSVVCKPVNPREARHYLQEFDIDILFCDVCTVIEKEMENFLLNNRARLQVVVLATPHSLHTEQIIACARAGKAVFCEKPLALKAADAKRSVEACKQAGVMLGIGTNKRFWPCMRELRRVVDSSVLGRLLHVEGHYSNENTGKHFSSWRTDPAEAPAAGLTGSGIHVLDALVSYAGPARKVQAQVLSLQSQPNPLDTIVVMFEFERGLSGTLAAIRSTPFYWRIHIFGSAGSAEALGEMELVVRLNGQAPQRTIYDPVDSLAAEFDAFADAVAGRAVYPISGDEMIATIAVFETVVASVNA